MAVPLIATQPRYPSPPCRRMGNPANPLNLYYRGTHLPDRLRSQLTHKSHDLYYFLVEDGAITGKGFPTRREVAEHQAENYPGEPYEVVSGKVGKPPLGDKKKSRKEINRANHQNRMAMVQKIKERKEKAIATAKRYREKKKQEGQS